MQSELMLKVCVVAHVDSFVAMSCSRTKFSVHVWFFFVICSDELGMIVYTLPMSGVMHVVSMVY